jgi:hypothetical protein
MCVDSDHTSVGLQWVKNISTDIYIYIYVSLSGISARSSTYLCKHIGRHNKLTTGLLTPHELYNERPYLVLLTSSHLHISSSGTPQCVTESVLYI